MTKDQAIKHLKLMQSGARNAIRYKKNDKGISEEERKEDIEIYQEQLEALEIGTKALETVEEFEKAQIITGGRLNGRTYAYKCGLEDGKRKALEQPTSDDCVSRKAVLNTLFYKSDNNCEVVLGKELRDRIKALPSARKSGLRWIERFDKENIWLECPHCHIDSAEAYNYCPNCGASFKEEK